MENRRRILMIALAVLAVVAIIGVGLYFLLRENDEDKVTLTGIAITTQPTEKIWWVGDKFDPEGMVVTATFSNNTTKPITEGLIFYPTLDTVLTLQHEQVVVSYTHEGVTRSATLDIEVREPRELTAIAATGGWSVTFDQGEKFDASDLIVTATYAEGEATDVTDLVRIYPNRPLTPNDFYITITYREGAVTKTYIIDITVVSDDADLEQRVFDLLLTIFNLEITDLDVEQNREMWRGTRRIIEAGRTAGFDGRLQGDTQLNGIIDVIEKIMEHGDEYGFETPFDMLSMFFEEYRELHIYSGQTAEFLWYLISAIHTTMDNMVDLLPAGDNFYFLLTEILMGLDTVLEVGKKDSVIAFSALLDVLEVTSEFFGFMFGDISTLFEYDASELADMMVAWRGDLESALDRLGADEIQSVGVFMKALLPVFIGQDLNHLREETLIENRDHYQRQVQSYVWIIEMFSNNELGIYLFERNEKISTLRSEIETLEFEYFGLDHEDPRRAEIAAEMDSLGEKWTLLHESHFNEEFDVWTFDIWAMQSIYNDMTHNGTYAWVLQSYAHHQQRLELYNSLLYVDNLNGFDTYHDKVIGELHSIIDDMVADWLNIRATLKGILVEVTAERVETILETMFHDYSETGVELENQDDALIAIAQILAGGLNAFDGTDEDFVKFIADWASRFVEFAILIEYEMNEYNKNDMRQNVNAIGDEAGYYIEAIRWIASQEMGADLWQAMEDLLVSGELEIRYIERNDGQGHEWKEFYGLGFAKIMLLMMGYEMFDLPFPDLSHEVWEILVG